MGKVSEIVSSRIGNTITNVNTWGGILTNVKAHGAIGDGVTDDTAAIQAAIDYALTVKGTVFIPSGTYVINNQINIGGSGSITIKGAGGKTRQTTLIGNVPAGGSMFNVTSTYLVLIDDIYMLNQSTSGKIISLALGYAHEIINCSFQNVSGNISDMVYFTGSNTKICNNSFTNNSTSFCIKSYAVVGTLNINCYIDSNYFGGVGQGISIDAEATTRSEGLKIVNNVFILTGGTQIDIKSILHIDISNNMLDQASVYGININPTDLGIDGVFIKENYISTASSPLEGVAIFCSDVAPTAVNVIISGNMIVNSGYGISAQGNANYWSISENVIKGINHNAIGMTNAKNVNIINNPNINGTFALVLADGASGGGFKVKDNVITGSVLITKTTPSKFVIDNNTGYTDTQLYQHVVESGSNANGYYVKFGDGTLICYGTIPLTATPASAETDITVTYALPFVTIASFNGSVIPNASWSGFFVKGTAPNTGSPLTGGLIRIVNGVTAQSASGSYMAIGRWL